MMSPAGGEHGSIVASVTAPLTLFVKQHGLGRIYGAETGFQIARDPDTVRAPDVGFVAAARMGAKPSRGFVPGPPDLAIEVVSPHDRASEVLSKVYDWLDAGCRAVWVVDPATRTVTIYRDSREAVILTSSDTLSGGELLPGFSAAVARFFAS